MSCVSDSRCEVSRGAGAAPGPPLECHELWLLDDEAGVATLAGLQVGLIIIKMLFAKGEGSNVNVHTNSNNILQNMWTLCCWPLRVCLAEWREGLFSCCHSF